jgi:hypothetical protein
MKEEIEEVLLFIVSVSGAGREGKIRSLSFLDLGLGLGRDWKISTVERREGES